MSGIWAALTRPSVKYSTIALLVIGAIVGLVAWGSLNTVINATSTLEFCITCHEMRDTVYAEYKETPHYQNRTGVRAICSDCHIPHEIVPKLLRKVKAIKELWGKATGVIDTPEKFEAMRMELATNEWKRMEGNGSHECRNCHAFGAMEAKKQKPKAQKKHEQAQKEGKTCINCHKGIAHLLPKEYEDPEDL